LNDPNLEILKFEKNRLTGTKVMRKSSVKCNRLQQLFRRAQSRSVGLDLSRRPPSAGQAPMAALRGSLGLVV